MSRERADRAPEEEAVGDVVEASARGRGSAVARADGLAGREGVERRGHARRRRRAGRASSRRRRTTATAGRAGPGRARRRGRARPRRRSAEHRGHQEDRRPHVEAEAVAPRAPPPCRRARRSSRTGRRVAARRQGAGRRQPAQPAADHADPSRLRSHSIARSKSIIARESLPSQSEFRIDRQAHLDQLASRLASITGDSVRRPSMPRRASAGRGPRPAAAR